MGCNLKVASIVVATLAITFSSLTLVKFCSSAYEEYEHHKNGDVIDQGGIVPKKEPWAARAPTTQPPTPTKSTEARYKEIIDKWNKRSTTRAERIIGIIVCIVSIVTSFMVFSAVSDDYDYNAMKRHMVLPFVIFHSIINFLHACAIFYIAITYRQYMDVLLVPILIYVSMVFVTITGISFVGAYHRSLSRMAGFAYAQMDDIQKEPIHDEVKKPLA